MMLLMMRSIAAVLLVAAVAPPVAAQQVRDAPAPPQATGRITGTVVGAESGRPVRFARVTLSGTSTIPEVLTGDDGAFVFDRLQPGVYTLQARKPGYLDTEFGQARPGTNTQGKRIVVAPKEQIERLVIPLSQGGSISGVVRDDRGDPAFRAHVRVAHWGVRNGIRMLLTVQSTETDERGRYRASLLAPRDYVVTAIPNEESVPATKQGPPSHGFAAVFYPGALSARAASVVALGLGEDKSQVDFQLPLVALGRVTGTVVGRDGRPVQNMPVSLLNNEHDDIEQGTETDAAGRFAFDGIVPGTYTVNAGRASHGHVKLAKHMATDGMGGYSFVVSDSRNESIDIKLVERLAKMEEALERRAVPAGSASGEVSVAGSASSDITLTIEPPRVVAGRIEAEGAAKPPVLRGTVVQITSHSLNGDAREAKVNADGTFVISDVAPGRYRITFAGEAAPWVLSTAISTGVDALDYLLEVPRDRDVRDLVLTLRDKSAELSGTVTDATSKPASNRTVVVFPSEERLWVAADRRIKAMDLAEDGKFLFEELRPGSYLLAVTNSVEPEEWLDPDFLRRLLGAAVHVTIAEGEKRVQDLRIR